MDIVSDTNVVSELMQPQVPEFLKSWMIRRNQHTFYATSITYAEVFYGIRILPEGQRHEALLSTASRVFDESLAGQILVFDRIAATHYSQIAAHRREIGRPISQFDAQIAAICRANDAAIATRNVRDFEDCGIEVLNPWAG